MKNQSSYVSRLTRVRASLRFSSRPRLTVFRSNQHIWAQVIDDEHSKTIASVNTKTLITKKGETKTLRAASVGSELARLTLAQKVKKIVFDRGAYKYHGRVKALADAARSGGLEF
ncbi:MAG: 50S ribosomal protein L18 [bacterium]